MLKQMLSLRGRFQRKILLLLVGVMTLLLLRQGANDDDPRDYPPESDSLPGIQRQTRDSNRELLIFREELLREDIEMSALEVQELDRDTTNMDSWIEVEAAQLPAPPETKAVDAETFEQPIALTLDTKVMTEAGVAFLERLQSGKSHNTSSRVTVLTVNLKAGPVFDLRFSLEPMGVDFIEYSFSPHCQPLGTCATGLDILTEDSALTLTHDVVDKFHRRYSQDEVFKNVDAFLCVYPTALCELFLPFNKSILISMETRYDTGRLQPQQWKKWNDHLVHLSENTDQHFIRATNSYDSEYVRYYTNFAPHVMSPICGYLQHAYNPSKPEFLLMPIRQLGFQEQFMKEFHQAVEEEGAGVTLLPVSQHYPDQKPSDLMQHQALVLVPHQVSYLALNELYRMGIPMFVPSMELLARWHLRSNVVLDKTWSERRKWQKRHGLFKGQQPLPDANDESGSDSIGFWLMFSDYYYQPHFSYYTSVTDLARRLSAASHNNSQALRETSSSMKKYNDLVFRKSNRELSKLVDKLEKQKSSHHGERDDARGL